MKICDFDEQFYRPRSCSGILKMTQKTKNIPLTAKCPILMKMKNHVDTSSN